MPGGNQWFGRINSRKNVEMLLDHVAAGIDGDAPVASQGELARHELKFR